MDRRLAPVFGLLLIASFYSFISGSGGAVRSFAPEGTRTTRSSNSASAIQSPAKPQAANSMKLLPRAELGPWRASCEFFLNRQDRSPAVPIDLAAPLAKQRVAAERAPFVETAVGSATGTAKSSSGDETLTSRWCADKNYDIQFLIATVPDPVNTHLALEFDRRI